MKKTISILAVLFIAAAVFASGMTAKVGPSYGYGLLNPAKDGDYQMSASGFEMSATGFGFHLGIREDYSRDLTIYAELDYFFPEDIDVTTGGNTSKYSDIVKNLEEQIETVFGQPVKLDSVIAVISTASGVACKLDLRGLELSVGGGLSISSILAELNGRVYLYSIKGMLRIISMGLSGLVSADYRITEDFRVGITAVPQIGFFSVSKASRRVPHAVGPSFHAESEGFEISLTMPVSVGISYTF